MTHTSAEIVAVIPCYDVSRDIERIVQATLKTSSHLIAVDDGSKDNTPKILASLARQFRGKMTVLTHPQNRGKGYALITGFKYALKQFDFKALVTLDADGQHLPEDIPRVAEWVLKGEDMVFGSRDVELMPFRRRAANTLISIFLRIIYPMGPLDTQSGFRGFSKKMIQEIVHMIPGGGFEMEFKCLFLALLKHHKIQSVKIATIYQDDYSSHFAPIKDSLKILWVFIKELTCHLLGKK